MFSILLCVAAVAAFVTLLKWFNIQVTFSMPKIREAFSSLGISVGNDKNNVNDDHSDDNMDETEKTKSTEPVDVRSDPVDVSKQKQITSEPVETNSVKRRKKKIKLVEYAKQCASEHQISQAPPQESSSGDVTGVEAFEPNATSGFLLS